jgi:predicted Ser/Thr protein kinase
MSGANLFANAHHFVASNSTFTESQTVSGMLSEGYLSSKLMALESLQIIHNNYGNRTTSDGVIALMPNPSTRFTGCTEAIAKLKRHFFTSTNGTVQRRKIFLLYGMGGIGKTQICLKFVEEMYDR